MFPSRQWRRCRAAGSSDCVVPPVRVIDSSAFVVNSSQRSSPATSDLVYDKDGKLSSVAAVDNTTTTLTSYSLKYNSGACVPRGRIPRQSYVRTREGGQKRKSDRTHACEKPAMW